MATNIASFKSSAEVTDKFASGDCFALGNSCFQGLHTDLSEILKPLLDIEKWTNEEKRKGVGQQNERNDLFVSKVAVTRLDRCNSLQDSILFLLLFK